MSDKLILDKFIEFVVHHKLIDKASVAMTIDEVIGTYIVNTIKQLYEEYESHKIWLDDKTAEDFETESFVEIIDAYLNGFNTLSSEDIVRWLVDLKKEIDQLENKKETSVSEKEREDNDATSNARSLNDHTSKDKKKPIEDKLKKEKSFDELLLNDPNIKLLSEIFPDMDTLKIADIYKKVNKNYEQAIELLLNEDAAAIVCKDTGLELTEEEKKILKEKTVKK